MAEVVLFHSVLGLRRGVIAAADRLRVPVQVHSAANAPWVEAEEEVVPLGAAVREAAFEECAYPDSGHLSTDRDLPEYDPASSETL